MSDVVVTRLIAASPATVFSFFTDLERWTSWQGVGGELDPRPGGVIRIRMPASTSHRRGPRRHGLKELLQRGGAEEVAAGRLRVDGHHAVAGPSDRTAATHWADRDRRKSGRQASRRARRMTSTMRSGACSSGWLRNTAAAS
jgi:Activator of Hsp90 ATPase homolog 1-like protein